MNRLGTISATALALVALTGATPTDSSKQTILIRSSDVTLRTDPDTTIGRYSTVSYTVPEGLTSAELERAILEVSVDVSAKRRGNYINPAPVLEAYALDQVFGEHFDPEILALNGRIARPVAIGFRCTAILLKTECLPRNPVPRDGATPTKVADFPGSRPASEMK